MLATPTATPGVPPSGPEWVHEVKWDGIRGLGSMQAGWLVMHNRNAVDVTVAWPDLVRPVSMGLTPTRPMPTVPGPKGPGVDGAGRTGNADDEAGPAKIPSGDSLPDDTVLDGEIVTVDASMRTSFQNLAHRFHVRDPQRAADLASVHPAQFMVFDVLRLAGRDVTALPWTARRELLESLALPPRWQLSPVHDDGAELAEVTRAMGLEGVMSKRRTSVYRLGTRSEDWVKVPHRHEVVAVIGGWVEDRENPGRLGSLWVGWPDDEATFDDDPVLYALGRVGSGLPHADRDALLGVLHEIARPSAPFESFPQEVDRARTHWVEPLLCVQVRYLGRSDSGALRQPVLRRLRPDVTPLDAATAEILPT